MNTIQKAVRSLVLAALLAFGLVAPSWAELISVVPSSQTKAPGDTVAIDIVLSGLTQAIGGFAFDLTFNPSILIPNVANTRLDPDNAMGPLHDFTFATGFGAGGYDAVVLADPGLSAVALLALEGGAGGSFRLAHVEFTGGATGLSPLNLAANPALGLRTILSDFLGNVGVPSQTANGSACIAAGGVGPCAVPEPGSLALLALGGMALGAIRRRRNA